MSSTPSEGATPSSPQGAIRPATDYLLEFSDDFVHLELLPLGIATFASTLLLMSGAPSEVPSAARLLETAQAATTGSMIIWFVSLVIAAVLLRRITAIMFSITTGNFSVLPFTERINVGPLGREVRGAKVDLLAMIKEDKLLPETVAATDPMVRDQLAASRLSYEREARMTAFGLLTAAVFMAATSAHGWWVALSLAPMLWSLMSYLNAVRGLRADRLLRRAVVAQQMT